MNFFSSPREEVEIEETSYTVLVGRAKISVPD
jgi:hypothetical protein